MSRSNEPTPSSHELPDYLVHHLERENPAETEARRPLLDVKNLLTADGVTTAINGEPAQSTECYYKTKTDQRTYYVRALHRLELGTDWYGLVFDESEDTRVDTPHASLIQFEERHDGRVVLASGARSGDELANQGVLEFSRTAVDKIKQAVAKKAQEASNQAAYERQQRTRKLRIVGERALALTLAGGAAGALMWGGLTFFKSDVFDEYTGRYDAKDYTLPVENQAALGETIQPSFSPELVAAGAGGIADAPDINSAAPDYIDDDSIDLNDGIRRIRLYSSEPDSNCGYGLIGQSVPEGTTLAAWTTAVTTDGTSRAAEFEVKYQEESVQVCWNGQEYDDGDDPLVYVRLIPPVPAS